MKKNIFLIGSMIFSLLLLSTCQPPVETVDVEAEKEAIMAVIQAESESARDGDPETLKSLYVQDEYNTRLSLTSDWYGITTGWDKLGPYFDRYHRDEERDVNVKITKENHIIKVMDDAAWLICDNNWIGTFNDEPIENRGMQITFLEKVDGEWKISFAAWLHKPDPYEEEKGTEE